jgi:predicted aldo/keto reductase-like oxidoreductase
LVHNISSIAQWDRLKAREFEDWVTEKKASGQIRSIGFSFHGEQEEFLKLLDIYDWEFCQIQYNYVNVKYQAGLVGLKRAAEKGIPVIVMEPLLGGKLANGLPKKAAEIFKQADDSWTPAQWALRWLLDQPEVTVVLSGMNADEQLDDNIAVADSTTSNSLSEDEKGVFEPVMKAFSESFKVPCTACNYCMPCPNHVNIPACFSAYNMSYATGFVSGMQQYLTSTVLINKDSNSGLGNCTQCGLCESKCPQHIKITDEFKRVRRRMEPFWIRAALKVVMRFM